MAARELPREQNGLPPIINFVWIVLSKSRSLRGASHQPVFIGSSLTIDYMY